MNLSNDTIPFLQTSSQPCIEKEWEQGTLMLPPFVFLSNYGQQDFKPMEFSLRPESGNPIRKIRVLSPPTQRCSLIGQVGYVQRLDVPLILEWRCLLPGVWTYSYGSANQLWCFFGLQDHLL
jgi:hypothetical protein